MQAPHLSNSPIKHIEISKARKTLPSLVNESFLSGSSYIITKRNIPVAKICPIEESSNMKDKTKKIDLSLFGVWQNEERTTIEVADELRSQQKRTLEVTK